MESEGATVFCDEDVQQKFTEDLLADLKARFQVDIVVEPGRFIINSPIQFNRNAAKAQLIETMRYVKTDADYQWCWQKDYNQVIPYDPETNLEIEQGFKNRQAEVEIEAAGKTFVLDFIYYVQRPKFNPSMARMIFRNPKPTFPNTNWQFYHEERWKNFNRETSDMCERAKNGSIEVIQVPFGKMGGYNIIDFTNNVMQDARGNSFNVRRLAK